MFFDVLQSDTLNSMDSNVKYSYADSALSGSGPLIQSPNGNYAVFMGQNTDDSWQFNIYDTSIDYLGSRIAGQVGFSNPSPIISVGLTNDGTKLLINSHDGDFLSIVEVDTGTVLASTGDSSGQDAVQINGDGSKVITFDNSEISFLDGADLTVLSTITDTANLPAAASRIEMLNNDVALVLNSNNNMVYAYDMITESLLWSKDLSAEPIINTLFGSPTGEKCFCKTDDGASYHFVIDTSDGTISNTNIPNNTKDFSGGGRPLSAKFNENEDFLILAELSDVGTDLDEGTISVYDIEKSETVYSMIYTDRDIGILGFTFDGAAVDLLVLEDAGTAIENSYVERREVMPKEGVLYFKDSNGKVLNSNSGYITNTLDLGEVYQTIPSDIFEITIVNNTALTLSELVMSSPSGVIFGSNSNDFEGLETLTFNSGPYNTGDEVTVYCKAKVSIGANLGASNVAFSVQGNE